MLLLSQPSETQIRQFLVRVAESHYTYSEVGATSALPPPLFTVDRNRTRLGNGLRTWQKATEAFKKWEMFNLEWVRLYPPDTPIATGKNVAIVAYHLHFYWINACRIVYTVDEDGPIKRFGFAYGTLDDHAESGEERFLVEWNLQSDEVSYDLLAFSRPHQFLSRVGRPFARRLQKLFAAESQLAMLRAITKAGS